MRESFFHSLLRDFVADEVQLQDLHPANRFKELAQTLVCDLRTA